MLTESGSEKHCGFYYECMVFRAYFEKVVISQVVLRLPLGPKKLGGM